ncbi:ParA family protein [Furfurilactobacillus milii]|uniref:AAA family ATPase n=1 Tax=Furfurilactobacillus milii TaxID=2888272 RepID=A0A6N9I0C4_9LACO|nr:AAA family ATPase [Furfurilactobacillus milii]MYV16441.1 AAA family ATPase [Furfurilactobacillus milii]
MTAKILVSGNFKGGTGKTTTATMTSIALARNGYRTLLIDLDPQANATDLFFKTKENITGEISPFDVTLLKAIQDRNLSKAIIRLDNNVDFIPSSADFSLYPRYMEKIKDEYIDRVQYLDKLINPLKEKYDFIMLDLPPTISLITDSALYASDWVLIVMQTQERSLQGAEGFIDYMQNQVVNDFHAPRLQVLGILPVLLKNGAPIDKSTLTHAIEEFGEENIFPITIHNMERLKRYDVTGVTSKDQFDRKVRWVYDRVTKEIIKRTGAK